LLWERAVVGDLVFKAMADATRRTLLQLLCLHELSVSELVQIVGQPQSTVSRHLRVLRDAELVTDRRDGVAVLSRAVIPGPNGQSATLRGRILDWVREQELTRPLIRRLDDVIRHRTAESLGFFEEVGHRWDQMRIEYFGDRFHLEALSALLPREWTVADIGTGTGYLLPTLVSHFRRVIAVDPVVTMLDIARSRRELTGRDNVDFRAGDLSALPIDAAGVDLAVAILVLHHVPSLQVALGEIARVTRPGGRVLIVEQQAHELHAFHDRMQDRWWGFEPEPFVEHVAGVGFTDVAWHSLLTAEPAGKASTEAPELFVVAGVRR
jgi:ArsR family transcriptional regulator